MRFSARRWRAPEYEAPSGRGPIPAGAKWTDILLHHLLPWFGGKLISLGWTFVSAMASYSPFLLMTLVENKMDEHRWKTMAQRQMRAREDFAIEEFSAYKDGDEVDQYVEEEGEKEGEEEEEEEENYYEEEEEEENPEEEQEEEEEREKKSKNEKKKNKG